MLNFKIIFLFLITWPVFLLAQWSHDPYENLKVSDKVGLNPEICSDGLGGCYLIWEAVTNDERRLIRIQRLNKYGYRQFPDDGIPVSLSESNQSSAKQLFSDGDNGAIIVFSDLIKVGDRWAGLYHAQRIDSAGNRLWGTNGVRLSPCDRTQYAATGVSDGQGGAIIFWREDCNNDGVSEIQGNRVNASGELVWQREILEYSNDVFNVFPTSDGGCVIDYADTSKQRKLQRLNSQGKKQWGESILISYLFGGFCQYTKLGEYGSFLAAKNQWPSVFGIWANRISRDGQVRWGEVGKEVMDFSDFKACSFSSILMENGLFCIAGAGDTYRANTDSLKGIVYVQWLDIDGTFRTSRPGIRADSENRRTYISGVFNSYEGSALVVWGSTSGDHFAQIVWPAGKKAWDKEVPITLRQKNGGHYVACSDGAGGLILAWFEIGSQTAWGVMAQQLSRNGNLGEVLFTGTHVKTPKSSTQPEDFNISIYPHPMREKCNITFKLWHFQNVSLKIYNIQGKEVKHIFTESLAQGDHKVQWNGTDEMNRTVPSGLYLYRFWFENAQKTGKILVIK